MINYNFYSNKMMFFSQSKLWFLAPILFACFISFSQCGDIYTNYDDGPIELDYSDVAKVNNTPTSKPTGKYDFINNPLLFIMIFG